MPAVQIVLIAFLVSLLFFATHVAAGLLLQVRKYSVKKTALLWASAGVFLFLEVSLCFLTLSKPWRMPVSLLLSYLYFLAVFIYVSADGFWKKCYLWITYGCVFCIALSVAFYVCYLIVPSASDTLAYFLRGVIYGAICSALLLTYYKFGRPVIREISGFRTRNWISLSAASLIYLLTFVLLLSKISADNGIDPDTLILFLLLVSSFAVASILIISNIHQMRKEARDELVKQNAEYLMSYVDNARKAEQENRRIRHDLRHHDERIASMAKAGDTQGILAYLGQSRETLESFPTWCPNATVNGVLNSYAGKAKDNGVEFIAQADTPARSGVADVDFVAILANLLENALNACVAQKSSGPIRARIRNVGNKTVIAVSNPCGPDLKLEDGLPAARGVGIDSIISSSAKYHGEINYKVEDRICNARVILNP